MSDDILTGATVAPRLIAVDALDPQRLAPIIGPERMARFDTIAAAARERIDGRSVLNVNSTAAGGGVAEMLQTTLSYARGAGVDARWMVIEGDAEFFAITKRVHNRLYGSPGDGGPLGTGERAHYEAVMRTNGARMHSMLRPNDAVVLHDPQTAGLTPFVRAAGAHVVWRCHIGRDEQNECSEVGWEFLRPYLTDADAYVFSRRAFAPPWLDGDRLHIIPPSIDPFAVKNVELDPPAVRSVMGYLGIPGLGDPTPVDFTRRDGSPGRIEHPVDAFLDVPPPADAPLVVQVSRWDPMKDMAGVMHGFVEHVPGDAHLLLVGPAVDGVADDAEAGLVLDECREQWQRLAPRDRARVHLACLPMHDVDANALLTNAVQRWATVVTQKSLAEGFGLTVAEAMWKRRPIVATSVGGIVDQITHGEQGLLVEDPLDLASFGASVVRLLDDPGLARRLGRNAHARAVDELLGDRHLEQWATMFASILE